MILERAAWIFGITWLSSLPPDLKKEVLDFVELLEQKTKLKAKVEERKFGYAQDFFKMAPDFDGLLEEYM